ncbi:hypothetical protein [Streptomyces albipurpureus]|uniref:Uncharacterized protein n=1 Tax=Streptomyces albipurpureus TaxID=2897419 RepID=A0ABT0V211_9ACTN|nr:hypothetical protein [Streptomyces sp. CWNU-1]MCM2393593.1 hypothetical protein [Streptomyces sp. CWNU-1]
MAFAVRRGPLYVAAIELRWDLAIDQAEQDRPVSLAAGCPGPVVEYAAAP